MTSWVDAAHAAAEAARAYADAARMATARYVVCDGKINAVAADQAQHRLHGFAWIATTVEALGAVANWAQRGTERGLFKEIDELILRIAFGEYLAQLIGGLPMSQTEFARPRELGLEAAMTSLAADSAVDQFLRDGSSVEARAALALLLHEGARPKEDLGDDALDLMRDQVRVFLRKRIVPHAHRWHLANDLIPDELIAEMGNLGLFAISVSPDYGGLGLGKLAMCMASEELSRGWICAGSLGTRTEIACELIATNGTDAQKRRWLPGLASGLILPAAVFTEPDTGSDLAALRTTARRVGAGWRVDGAKNWITHAGRADLMTILARTDPSVPGHDGLSILIAEKARGENFPAAGLTGSEIPVLGYRGMREYALSFDGFAVDADGLLGGVEGRGFRQLMRTFESARIQTAARAVGVAWSALDFSLRYAGERRQFGGLLLGFPRISDKLALMMAELVAARELTYAAARAKDEGRRCDVEAGMAKLLAARVAWSNADQGVQIHGGNGYALEFEASRLLCDARVLSIFEGTSEIQAHVIARGLLVRGTAGGSCGGLL
jgi:(2S)-methylsuccinyl-CoA dehydrogenase